MILKYGGYAHDNHECAITAIHKQALFSETGARIGYRERWRIRGVKHAPSQAELTDALTRLEAAYAVDGNDLVLYLDDGATETRHALRQGQSRSGVRVTEFTYPEGEGAEYSTFRTYQIGVEAEFLSAANEILSWVETLTTSGGAEVWTYLPTLTGPPQRQILHQQTSWLATQSGQAVGLNGWPTPADPLWPHLEHADRRRIEHGTPRFLPNGDARFPVSWSYQFESDQPFFGRPRLL
jgi:hypothetical protein